MLGVFLSLELKAKCLAWPSRGLGLKDSKTKTCDLFSRGLYMFLQALSLIFWHKTINDFM